MTEPKRPARRPRAKSTAESTGDDNPYLDAPKPRAKRAAASASPDAAPASADAVTPRRPRAPRRKAEADAGAPAPENAGPASTRAEPPRAEPAPEPGPEPAPARGGRGGRRPRGGAAEAPVDAAAQPQQDRPPEPRADRYQPSGYDPAERVPAERREPENQYDRAFNRTDGPERGERPERQDRPERPDRPFENRRERGGRRRGRHRNRDRGERSGGAERFGQAPQGDRPERQDRAERPERSAPEAGGERPDRFDSGEGGFRRNGRRGRNRFRRGGGGGGNAGAPTEGGFDRAPQTPVAVEGTMAGWFDASRDGGFLRRSVNSYLPDPADPFVPPALVRLHQLRRGDKLDVTYGRDQRGRSVVVEVQHLNDGSPVVLEKRPDFNTLVASYPDRKLTLETGRPAKTGPELTRRAIDLIAPIGYGQRALIVAPARAGKTTLLQAIVEGVSVNHPQAVLLVLLVDERPEEVSEMVTWGYGEVVASSFDMPPKRHTEVAEMTLERARRLVEMGKDVVIVLDSITRMARAHNTVDRGTGRTMSGGLDATAMQKPKAFFGSARMIAQEHGGGSLTIIATALVETGSRMDDIIFEEFKGTGNCEIKLDRSLADRRIFPAFDIAVSGTRREEKLFRPDQLEKVHLLRRGLAQLPPQAGMEWLIKRIAATSNNDSLLDGL
jgi:transcription termination factor Rho